MNENTKPGGKGKSRLPTLILIYSGDLASVEDEDRKPYQPKESLLDKLQSPVGDGLLIALRRIFTATYDRDTTLVGLEKIIREIRHEAIEGLRGLERMLAALRLKPLGPGALPEDYGGTVHKFSLARSRDLPRKVKVEGERGMRSFFELALWADAAPLLVALRKIVSITFGELITRKGYVEAVWGIRKLAADALVPLNKWLEEIDLEPIAMPTREYNEEEWEDDPEHPRNTEE